MIYLQKSKTNSLLINPLWMNYKFQTYVLGIDEFKINFLTFKSFRYLKIATKIDNKPEPLGFMISYTTTVAKGSYYKSKVESVISSYFLSDHICMPNIYSN